MWTWTFHFIRAVLALVAIAGTVQARTGDFARVSEHVRHDLVAGFGGYDAVPFTVAGWLADGENGLDVLTASVGAFRWRHHADRHGARHHDRHHDRHHAEHGDDTHGEGGHEEGGHWGHGDAHPDDAQLAAVPLPASGWLLTGAIGGLIVVKRRRRG